MNPEQDSVYSRAALTATIAAVVLIAIASLGPFQFRVTHGELLRRHFHLFGIWDVTTHTLMHLAAFGLLGCLAALISAQWRLRIPCVLGVILSGLAIESVQYLSQSGKNPFEMADLRSDSLSATVGALLVCVWIDIRKSSDVAFTL